MERDPAIIQRQIEDTRADLAQTLEAIAEIVSPRRATERVSEQVRARVSGLRARVRPGTAPALGQASPNGQAGSGHQPTVAPGTAAAPGTPGQVESRRVVRWGRVAMVVSLMLLLVARTSRRRRRRRG
ncbi:MAG: DUF3618 domain-containing protein [Frankia sp.]|nr:DUF3618 domain-containing protein [Frankia sp.]